MTSEERNGTVTNYQYDDTNQLTDDDVTSYSYDANGNRTMSGYQTDTGNQVTNDGTYTYTYDDAGNLTKKSKAANDTTWTYGWDNRNQLIWVEKRATDGGTLQMRAEYKYDVFGNRIEKAVDADGAGGGGTVTTRFALDGDHVWADLDSSNDLTMRRLYTNRVDEVVARIDNGGTEAWYYTDRLGSVREMVDGSGTLQNEVTYDGFGGIQDETAFSFGDGYKWAGRYLDTESTLQGVYDPAIGQWITTATLPLGAKIANLYEYGSNNPLQSIILPDPPKQDTVLGIKLSRAPQIIPIRKENGDRDLLKDEEFYKVKGTGYILKTKWTIADQKADGWIMQKVTIKYDIEDAAGNKPPKFYDEKRRKINPKRFEFWELWRVKEGKIYTDRFADKPGDIDSFGLNHQLLGTKGTQRIEGEAVYFTINEFDYRPGDKVNFDPKSIREANYLTATDKEPAVWKNLVRAGKKKTIKHFLQVKYDFVGKKEEIKKPDVDYSPKK